jgi:hypothetical protein
VGSSRKHQVERERHAGRDVRTYVSSVPEWVQEQTVMSIYLVLPPEETKQYPHGDFSSLHLVSSTVPKFKIEANVRIRHRCSEDVTI